MWIDQLAIKPTYLTKLHKCFRQDSPQSTNGAKFVLAFNGNSGCPCIEVLQNTVNWSATLLRQLSIDTIPVEKTQSVQCHYIKEEHASPCRILSLQPVRCLVVCVVALRKCWQCGRNWYRRFLDDKGGLTECSCLANQSQVQRWLSDSGVGGRVLRNWLTLVMSATRLHYNYNLWHCATIYCLLLCTVDDLDLKPLLHYHSPPYNKNFHDPSTTCASLMSLA